VNLVGGRTKSREKLAEAITDAIVENTKSQQRRCLDRTPIVSILFPVSL